MKYTVTEGKKAEVVGENRDFTFICDSTDCRGVGLSIIDNMLISDEVLDDFDSIFAVNSVPIILENMKSMGILSDWREEALN